jgi:adenylylsulfate kinase-like enzyme
MIIVFFGQPCSGKTTNAKALQKEFFISEKGYVNIVDGDDIRKIFNNTDYTKEGRIRNLNRISDIAIFLANQHENVIVSAVYPYLEAREYMEKNSNKKILWVYLIYNEVRGREEYHVQDFEIPLLETKNLMVLNTSVRSLNTSVVDILSFCKKIEG